VLQAGLWAELVSALFCVRPSSSLHLRCMSWMMPLTGAVPHAGLITPREALEEACRSLKAVCAHMKQTFRREMDAKGVGAAAEEMET